MGLAIRLFAAVKAVALFAAWRPKDAVIILVTLLLAVMFWRLQHEQRRSREMATKIEGLPPNTKQVVTVYRDRVVTKWRDGTTKIEYRDRYLPPEGHVEVTVKEGQPERLSEIVVKDRGFTKRLGGGFVYSGRLLPEIDLKLAYWRYYGLTIGVTPEYGGVGISRRVSDFTPFGNLEILGLTGLGWHSDPRFGLGLRVNF